MSIVRSWVTDGAGPQSTDDVRATAAGHDLLAVSGTLVLMVHGIDRDATPVVPTVELDFVQLYDGDDAFSRKLLTDAEDWNATVVPALHDAARVLESYRVRRVHVAGSMRHPMWFAIGRSLPEVKKWTLSVDQVGGAWRTNENPEPVEARVLTDVSIDRGSDLAVGLGLTGDPSRDIERFLRTSHNGVGRLLVFGPEGDPSSTSVPSGAWAIGWARSVRNQARAAMAGAERIHVFFLCPAGVALMLGHQWELAAGYDCLRIRRRQLPPDSERDRKLSRQQSSTAHMACARRIRGCNHRAHPVSTRQPRSTQRLAWVQHRAPAEPRDPQSLHETRGDSMPDLALLLSIVHQDFLSRKTLTVNNLRQF